jgi:hypothetical protein
MSLTGQLQGDYTHIMFQRLDNVPCLTLDHRKLSLNTNVKNRYAHQL